MWKSIPLIAILAHRYKLETISLHTAKMPTDPCTLSCGIALGLILTSITISYNAEKLAKTSKLKKTFTQEQLERYERIVKSRKNIYLSGLSVGLVLSLLLIFLNIQSGNKLHKLSTSCLAAAITLGAAYLYYTLHPKTEYIITELNTKEQREEWLKIYKQMQFSYHLGLALSLFAVFALSYTVCK